MKTYYVYLLTNWNNKVMYVGMTNNLERRIYEHKNKLINGFTKKYNINKLVYYEETSDVNSALSREKEIKKWRRETKDTLVLNINPEWKDLSDEWLQIPHNGSGYLRQISRPAVFEMTEGVSSQCLPLSSRTEGRDLFLQSKPRSLISSLPSSLTHCDSRQGFGTGFEMT